MALSQWIKEIREWAGESISALVAAQYAADSRQAPQVITDHIIHLTTLTDQGRLLLPNVRKDEYGHHKSEAFQGYRHPTLDILVAAVVVLKNSQDYEDRSLYLKKLRKIFVTHITLILDPSSFNRKIKHLLDSLYRKTDSKIDPLLPGNVPPGAEQLLIQVEQKILSKAD